MEKDLLGLEKETLLLDYFNGELDDAQSDGWMLPPRTEKSSIGW